MTLAESPQWRKGGRCDSNACVEVARSGDEILVRSSLRPHAIMRLSRAEFRAFCSDLANGRYGRRLDRD